MKKHEFTEKKRIYELFLVVFFYYLFELRIFLKFKPKKLYFLKN